MIPFKKKNAFYSLYWKYIKIIFFLFFKKYVKIMVLKNLILNSYKKFLWFLVQNYNLLKNILLSIKISTF